MNTQNNTKQVEPLRYERKYLITDYTHLEVEQLLKYHPATFSEIFHERKINNIYFDSFGLTHYFDNLEGSPNRSKVRIRWYNDTFGEIKKPVLEYKIKNGLLGKKDSFELLPFVINRNFSKLQIENALQSTAISKNIKNELLSLHPTLLNSYIRKYFLSANKNFRITIDHHLSFYGISYNGNTFTNKSIDYNTTVLELKYDSIYETEAKEISNFFPFSITKSSKYLQGLERVYL